MSVSEGEENAPVVTGTPQREQPTAQSPRMQSPFRSPLRSPPQSPPRAAAGPPPSLHLSQSQWHQRPGDQMDEAVDENRPRLMMTKMVLINFKSYAGSIEIGPFHKSFTSVVGPNGTGKSNVIDALMFVFGYRAKKLRQGKLGDLIHKSKQFPNLQECTVEIHFQEIIDRAESFDIVPNTSLIIARSADAQHKSDYRINRKRSNFTEVTTLLKAKGVDLDHKRFLILQVIFFDQDLPTSCVLT